jgi:hypothetical protein
LPALEAPDIPSLRVADGLAPTPRNLNHEMFLHRSGQSGLSVFLSRMTVQKKTARNFKNIQNGKIASENERHAWEQGSWAIPILGKSLGSS